MSERDQNIMLGKQAKMAGQVDKLLDKLIATGDLTSLQWQKLKDYAEELKKVPKGNMKQFKEQHARNLVVARKNLLAKSHAPKTASARVQKSESADEILEKLVDDEVHDVRKYARLSKRVHDGKIKISSENSAAAEKMFADLSGQEHGHAMRNFSFISSAAVRSIIIKKYPDVQFERNDAGFLAQQVGRMMRRGTPVSELGKILSVPEAKIQEAVVQVIGAAKLARVKDARTYQGLSAAAIHGEVGLTVKQVKSILGDK